MLKKLLYLKNIITKCMYYHHCLTMQNIQEPTSVKHWKRCRHSDTYTLPPLNVPKWEDLDGDATSVHPKQMLMNGVKLSRCLPLFYRLFNTIPYNPMYQKHNVLLAFTR